MNATVDSTTPPLPDNDGLNQDDILSRHLTESRLLIAYLSRSGKEVPPELFENFAGYSRTPIEEWDSSTEAKFWKDLNLLSRIARPATIETIELNSGLASEGNSHTEAKRKAREGVVNRYSIVALLSMIVVLAFQIYWVVGTNVLDRTIEAQSNLQSLNAKMTDLVDQITSLDKRIDRQREKVVGGKPDVDVLMLEAEFKRLTEVDRQNLEAAIKSAQQTVNALFSTLTWTTLKVPHFFASMGAEQQIFIEFQKILNTTTVEYFLPLLLGLLGATVYVLRSMSVEIHDKTFLPGNAVNYRLRLYLGMIAGLTFAWLFAWLIPSGQDTGLGAAPPQAVAFVVGYSVEVLFSGLDRAIGYLTRKGSNST